MHLGFRLTRFPTSSAEAAELAASSEFASGESRLVIFAELPGGIVLVNIVTKYAACPCHTDIAPTSVDRLSRLLLVRLPDLTDADTAICGWHNGLHAAAESAGNLVDSLVVVGDGWQSWKDPDVEQGPVWMPVPDTGLSLCDLDWGRFNLVPGSGHRATIPRGRAATRRGRACRTSPTRGQRGGSAAGNSVPPAADR